VLSGFRVVGRLLTKKVYISVGSTCLGIVLIEAVFPQAREWGALFTSVSKIVDEISVSFKKEGVSARAMDNAHLSMVDFYIPKNAFETYTVIEEANLGIKLDDLNSVLKRATKNDKLRLSFDPSENSLVLAFISQIKREFVVNLIELGSNTPPMPNLSYEVTAIADPTALKEAVKDVGVVSDFATFEAEPNALYIKSKSSRGSVSLEFTKESGYLLDYQVKSDKKKIRASYGIKYLEYITSVDEAVSVSISFSNSAPLKLEYQIPGDIKLSFLLAPRADDE